MLRSDDSCNQVSYIRAYYGAYYTTPKRACTNLGGEDPRLLNDLQRSLPREPETARRLECSADRRRGSLPIHDGNASQQTFLNIRIKYAVCSLPHKLLRHGNILIGQRLKPDTLVRQDLGETLLAIRIHEVPSTTTKRADAHAE